MCRQPLILLLLVGPVFLSAKKKHCSALPGVYRYISCGYHRERDEIGKSQQVLLPRFFHVKQLFSLKRNSVQNLESYIHLLSTQFQRMTQSMLCLYCIALRTKGNVYKEVLFFTAAKLGQEACSKNEN